MHYMQLSDFLKKIASGVKRPEDKWNVPLFNEKSTLKITHFLDPCVLTSSLENGKN